MKTVRLSQLGQPQAWTVHTGDPMGAILAGALAGVQAVPTKDQDVTVYSYLLETLDLSREL